MPPLSVRFIFCVWLSISVMCLPGICVLMVCPTGQVGSYRFPCRFEPVMASAWTEGGSFTCSPVVLVPPPFWALPKSSQGVFPDPEKLGFNCLLVSKTLLLLKYSVENLRELYVWAGCCTCMPLECN